MSNNENIDSNERKRIFIAYFWLSTYIILLCIVNILFVLLFHSISLYVNLFLVILTLLLTILLWKKTFNEKLLYAHNILNFFGAIFLALLFSIWLSKPERLISFIIPIGVIDFISFTKLGKWTPNRKLIENRSFAKRLSICLPIQGYKGLYQISGIGDMFVFALLVASTLKIWGIPSIWIPVIAILSGQIPNIFGMLIFRNKKWYRGIPATTFPVLIYILLIFIYKL